MALHIDKRARDVKEAARVAELPGDFLLTTDELASWLGVNPISIKRWRQKGVGPRAVQAGLHAVRFRKDNVLAWLDQRAVDGAKAEA